MFHVFDHELSFQEFAHLNFAASVPMYDWLKWCKLGDLHETTNIKYIKTPA